jgi:hypothetical protein
MPWWRWTGGGMSFADFWRQVQAEPNSAEYQCAQVPVDGVKLLVSFRRVINGGTVARTSSFTVFDPNHILPPQFVASWCEALGLDTDDYGVDEDLGRP